MYHVGCLYNNVGAVARVHEHLILMERGGSGAYASMYGYKTVPSISNIAGMPSQVIVQTSVGSTHIASTTAQGDSIHNTLCTCYKLFAVAPHIIFVAHNSLPDWNQLAKKRSTQVKFWGGWLFGRSVTECWAKFSCNTSFFQNQLRLS